MKISARGCATLARLNGIRLAGPTIRLLDVFRSPFSVLWNGKKEGGLWHRIGITRSAVLAYFFGRREVVMITCRTNTSC